MPRRRGLIRSSTRLSAAPDLAKLTEPPRLSGRTNPYVRMASSQDGNPSIEHPTTSEPRNSRRAVELRASTQWVIPGDLDDHQGDAIGIPDPHFHQPPALDAWGLGDRDARRLKLSVDPTQVAGATAAPACWPVLHRVPRPR